MLRAVLEGTAFALLQVKEWLAGKGLTAERVVAMGGGSRNPLQVRILADVLGVPVLTAGVEEGCRGAALLGAVAAGLVDLETARALAPPYELTQPDPATAAAYPAACERFLSAQVAPDTLESP
jgi:xylulokinase